MIHVQYNSLCVCVWVQELELVEDVWRGEAQDLLSQIAQLQEENKTLLTNMSMKDPMSEEELQRHEGEDVELHLRKVLSSLKEKENVFVCVFFMIHTSLQVTENVSDLQVSCFKTLLYVIH